MSRHRKAYVISYHGALCHYHGIPMLWFSIVHYTPACFSTFCIDLLSS